LLFDQTHRRSLRCKQFAAAAAAAAATVRIDGSMLNAASRRCQHVIHSTSQIPIKKQAINTELRRNVMQRNWSRDRSDRFDRRHDDFIYDTIVDKKKNTLL
jgi:hypothetical protein